MNTAGPICLVVQQGFSIRILLQTDVLPRLLEQGATVVVLAPAAEAASLAGSLPDAVPVVVAPAMGHPGRLQRYFETIRRSLHAGHAVTAHEVFRRTLTDTPSASARLVQWGLFGLARLLAATRPTRRLVPWIEARLLPDDRFDTLLSEMRPALLVTTSTGCFGFDAAAGRAARRLGIGTATLVLSWDNITSKSYPAFFPDHALAWTETMKHSLVGHTDFRTSQVTVCGVPHFDVYSRPDPDFDREATLRAAGLDPARRTVLVAGKSPNSYAWNAWVVGLLAEAVEDGRLPDCQILHRPHPIHWRRDADGRLPYAAALEDCEALAARYPFVIIDHPAVAEGSRHFAMQSSEVMRVARLLRASDVLVNLFSTMNIEGALLNRPLVNVCFEPGAAAPGGRARLDITSDLIEDHNQRIVDSGGAPVAFTPAQMIEHVRRGLDDPAADEAARRLIGDREGGPNRGRAGRTVADVLLFLAGRA